MASKTKYNYCVDPQTVDFTLRATLPAMTNSILSVAGVDAHNKGFGVDALNADNYSWVLSRMALELDYLPSQYTNYDITTWISDYGRLLSTRNFTLTDALSSVFGHAVTQWCMIDLTARKAVDLSTLVGAHDSAIVNIPSPIEMPHKIQSVAPEITTEHKVVYSDIDFNRHVNTLRYIEMMFDMLPIGMLAEKYGVRFDIHFMRECRYGQTLTIGYEQRDNISFFEIRDEQGTNAVRASIEWRK